ncbi:hypothetical protein R3P38DRAFT_3008008 [Favolaschia claudopus]|uniref:BTB domain-containing protein n=1 Tax=Favolaschia claudopus TaxID=2862362 RepID=A0AAW0AKE9_9AGAR
MVEGSPNAFPALLTSAPFDDATADTILRSSDGVDFHVYRIILSCASPFFKDMFSLPQANSTDLGLPIIPLSEHSRLLDSFLRVWYPGAKTVPFENVDQLADVIELALVKYDLEYLAPFLQKQLLSFKELRCFSVFYIACRYGWDDIVKDAARQSLTFDIQWLIGRNSSHLKYITGHNYQALLRYHAACSQAASSAGRLLPWADAEYTWIHCTTCAAHPAKRSVPGLEGRIAPRAWIFQYLDDAAAVLKQKPGANVKDPGLVVGAHHKIMACHNLSCRINGLRDLSKFIAEKYVPAINEAINAVPLRI